MNHQESEAPSSEDTVDALKSKNHKLRALLDGLDLTPEQTKEDISKPSNRDSEILRDVPPHHGN